MKSIRNCYKAEVAGRRRQYVEDQETEAHLCMAAKWLTSKDTKPSLLIFGGLGNGKTTLAQSIVESLESMKGAFEDFKTNVRLNYDRSIADLKMTNYKRYIDVALSNPPEMAEADKYLALFPKNVTVTTAQKIADLAADREKEKDNFDKIKKSNFLVMDDLGCEPTAVKNFGTEITPIIDVIYYRYDVLAPTIITTNLDKNDIKNRYGIRVIDRLNEMCESIAFTNQTYRQ